MKSVTISLKREELAWIRAQEQTLSSIIRHLLDAAMINAPLLEKVDATELTPVAPIVFESPIDEGDNEDKIAELLSQIEMHYK